MMLTYTELWKEIKDPLLGMIPGLLSILGCTSGLLFIVPNITVILSKLVDFYYHKYILHSLERDFDASIEIHKYNERKSMNQSYRVINWYIIKGINENSLAVKRLVCNESTVLDDDYLVRDEAHFNSEYTIIPDEDYYVDIHFKGQIFKATHYVIGIKRDIPVYKIYGDNIDKLKEFEKYCLEAHREYSETLGKDVYKYFEWDVIDQLWLKHDIETVKTIDNIFINKKQKEDLRNKLTTFNESKEQYKKWGIPYKMGLVFYGTPGCGKTSTIYAIANYLGRSIYFLKLNIFNSNTSLLKAVHDIPRDAVVVLEDIDAHRVTHTRTKPVITRKKQYNDDTEDVEDGMNIDNDEYDEYNEMPVKKYAPDPTPNLNSDKTIDSLLEIFDGYNLLPGGIIIITTNHIDKLDKALIRPGRMDHHYHFSYASDDIINEILEFFFPNEPKETLNKTWGIKKLSTAELINSIILPNFKNCQKVLQELTKLQNKS